MSYQPTRWSVQEEIIKTNERVLRTIIERILREGKKVMQRCTWSVTINTKKRQWTRIAEENLENKGKCNLNIDIMVEDKLFCYRKAACESHWTRCAPLAGVWGLAWWRWGTTGYPSPSAACQKPSLLAKTPRTSPPTPSDGSEEKVICVCHNSSCYRVTFLHY